MTRVHHTGYLVKHLEKSRGSFLSLDFRALGEPVYDEDRDVDILFLEKLPLFNSRGEPLG